MCRSILLAALCCSLTLSTASQAQHQTFYGGCVDAAGNAVAAVEDVSLPGPIDTRVEDGRAVIRYNTAALPGIGERGHLFLFAHECARLNLGMAPTAPRNRDDARRADCWAGDMLRRSGLVPLEGLAALQPVFEPGVADWRLLPGPMRRIDLLSCPRHLSPSLQAPPSGQDAWNTCARHCADTLYACQHRAPAAPCEAAHTQCMSRCDLTLPK